MNKKLLSFGLFLLSFQAISAQTLDADFGTNGKVVTAIGIGNDGITAIAVLPDGKILAAGETHNGNNYNFAVVKYNPDGTPDMGFGTNGVFILEFLVDSAYGVREMKVLPDGKILLAGSTGVSSNQDQFALARLNANGTLDADFGGGGFVTQGFGSALEEELNAMDVGSDGKIVVVGKSDRDIGMMCFNANGTLDDDFGPGGKIILNIGNNNASDSSYETAAAVEILPDGKFLVCGLTDKDNTPEVFDFYLMRFNANGSADEDFGTDGMAITDFGSSEQPTSLAVTSEGKIIVSGVYYLNMNGSQKAAVAQYDADGNLDENYADNGKAIITLNSNDIGFINDAFLQPDGKLLLAGYELDNDIDMITLRLNTDGQPDNSFGTGGKLVTDFGGSVDGGFAVAVQPDGKLIIAGRAAVTPTFDFAMARYESVLAVPGINPTAISISPNPFTNEINVCFPEAVSEVSALLFDLNGRKITELQSSVIEDNVAHFAMPELSKGVYFMQVSSGGNSSVLKIVKE